MKMFSCTFQESEYYAMLKEEFDPADPSYTLGDEAYACEDICLTPIADRRISTPQERRYNAAHKRSRVLIEHCYGVLKKRWPVLLYKLRKKKLEYSQAIVYSAAVLHNMAIQLREPEPELPDNLSEEEYQARVANLIPDDAEEMSGNNFWLRDRIIRNYF